MLHVNVDRRTLLKATGTTVVVGGLATGEVAAHRPDEIDWYSHFIVDCDGTRVVIEDNLPPDGNRFSIDRERLLAHIRRDHGWSDAEIAAFETELSALCGGTTPDRDVLDWYSHRIVDCVSGARTTNVTIRDGLGREFEVSGVFLEEHLEHDHGWERPERSRFFAALHHFCRAH